MLAYTVVVSPGYYVQTEDYAFIGMFVVLTALTLSFIVVCIWKKGEMAS